MIYFNNRNGSSGLTLRLIPRMISATAIYGRWNISLRRKGRWYPTIIFHTYHNFSIIPYKLNSISMCLSYFCFFSFVFLPSILLLSPPVFFWFKIFLSEQIEQTNFTKYSQTVMWHIFKHNVDLLIKRLHLSLCI